MDKYAFEIDGGIQVCAPKKTEQGDAIDFRAVYPGDADWPSAFILLIKTKEKQND